MVKKSFFPLLEEDFADPFELLDEREELDELTLELDFTELLDLAEEDEILPLDEGLDPSLLLRMTPEDESSPQAARLIVAIRARMGREKNFMSRGR